MFIYVFLYVCPPAWIMHQSVGRQRMSVGSGSVFLFLFIFDCFSLFAEVFFVVVFLPIMSHLMDDTFPCTSYLWGRLLNILACRTECKPGDVDTARSAGAGTRWSTLSPNGDVVFQVGALYRRSLGDGESGSGRPSLIPGCGRQLVFSGGLSRIRYFHRSGVGSRSTSKPDLFILDRRTGCRHEHDEKQ